MAQGTERTCLLPNPWSLSVFFQHTVFLCQQNYSCKRWDWMLWLKNWNSEWFLVHCWASEWLRSMLLVQIWSIRKENNTVFSLALLPVLVKALQEWISSLQLRLFCRAEQVLLRTWHLHHTHFGCAFLDKNSKCSLAVRSHSLCYWSASSTIVS